MKYPYTLFSCFELVKSHRIPLMAPGNVRDTSSCIPFKKSLHKTHTSAKDETCFCYISWDFHR